MMAADTMEELGIPRGSYVVKVNNRKVLDGVLDSIGLAGEVNSTKRLTVLRAIDKLDRLGAGGVRLLLGPGRKDESGDFTKGAGLGDHEISRLLTFLRPVYGSAIKRDEVARPYGDMEFLDSEKFVDNVGTIAHMGSQLDPEGIGFVGVQELIDIAGLYEQSGYGSRRIKIDPTVVRGLEYYTGPVFEVELTFSTDGRDGSPRFGSVGGGGRYDGLVSRFRGEPVPATGFSIGVSRLAAALEYLGKLDTKPEAGPVVVTVFDKDRLADYQSMVAKLRAAKIRAELYLGNPRNLGNQLKYADKRNAPCVVIQGGDEKAKGEVTIKDLIVGAELAKLEKGREEHLQKQAQAQRAVPEAKLVDAVREVLVRHGLASR
jgi:histidyl-tRNA synthetase